jgi:hypothetical protein
MSRLRRLRSTAILPILLAAAACASAGAGTAAGGASPAALSRDTSWVSDVMYFGMSIPGGGVVSDSAFDGFVRDVVTPRFPEGLTMWAAHGQWRGAERRIVREDSRVIQVVHPPTAVADSAVEAIAVEYKRRFAQESVLRVRSRVEVRF